MKKRILALVMAMAMIFALAACSSPSGDNSEPPVNNSSEPVENSEQPGEPEGPTQTDTLKIGLLVHQTGWFAGVDTPNYNEFNAMVD